MLSYVIPSRNRSRRLAATLDALARLPADGHDAAGGAEIIVVDDASDEPIDAPAGLRNGLPVHLVRTERQRGAAARNIGAGVARGAWLVMLDDDSYPLDTGIVEVLARAAPDVAALGAEIVRPDGTRELGGLPEVFVGCGAAIRRAAFLEVGGYDESFDYYVEEYDLCARLLARGWRVGHDWGFRVRHERYEPGRDADALLRRLTRNRVWFDVRYAPDHRLSQAIASSIARCATIARREGAMVGHRQGLAELRRTLRDQPRHPLEPALWDRLTGAAAARGALASIAGTEVALVEPGRGARTIAEVLRGEIGCTIVPEPVAAHRVVGVLSPGPMMDARERERAAGRRVVLPWQPTALWTPPRRAGLRRQEPADTVSCRR